MPSTRKCVALAVVLAAPILLAQNAPTPAATSPAGPGSIAPSSGAPGADATPTGKPSPATKSPETGAHTHRKGHKEPVPPPAILPPLPSGPLSQVPMNQLPPTPAKVTFQGGMLTISAQNSTLGDILKDVKKLTGTSIEFPSGNNGSGEHVVTHLGPGTPRDVLVSLLNGTTFNYVMLGSNSDPTVVASVILTPKESAGGAPNAPNNANMNQNAPGAVTQNRFPVARNFNPQQAVVPGNVVPAPAEEEAQDENQDNAEENADEQPAQETPDANAQAQPGQPDPNQPNAGPKTPEQILEMLRRQQQPGAAVNPQPGQQPQQPPPQEQQ